MYLNKRILKLFHLGTAPESTFPSTFSVSLDNVLWTLGSLDKEYTCETVAWCCGPPVHDAGHHSLVVPENKNEITTTLTTEIELL